MDFKKVQSMRAVGGTRLLVSLDDVALHMIDLIYDDIKSNIHVRPSLNAVVRRAVRAYASKLSKLDEAGWHEERVSLGVAASGGYEGEV